MSNLGAGGCSLSTVLRARGLKTARWKQNKCNSGTRMEQCQVESEYSRMVSSYHENPVGSLGHDRVSWLYM